MGSKYCRSASKGAEREEMGAAADDGAAGARVERRGLALCGWKGEFGSHGSKGAEREGKGAAADCATGGVAGARVQLRGWGYPWALCSRDGELSSDSHGSDRETVGTLCIDCPRCCIF